MSLFSKAVEDTERVFEEVETEVAADVKKAAVKAAVFGMEVSGDALAEAKRLLEKLVGISTTYGPTLAAQAEAAAFLAKQG
jgi:hypothetical protein